MNERDLDEANQLVRQIKSMLSGVPANRSEAREALINGVDEMVLKYVLKRPPRR